MLVDSPGVALTPSPCFDADETMASLSRPSRPEMSSARADPSAVLASEAANTPDRMVRPRRALAEGEPPRVPPHFRIGRSLERRNRYDLDVFFASARQNATLPVSR